MHRSPVHSDVSRRRVVPAGRLSAPGRGQPRRRQAARVAAPSPAAEPTAADRHPDVLAQFFTTKRAACGSRAVTRAAPFTKGGSDSGTRGPGALVTVPTTAATVFASPAVRPPPRRPKPNSSNSYRLRRRHTALATRRVAPAPQDADRPATAGGAPPTHRSAWELTSATAASPTASPLSVAAVCERANRAACALSTCAITATRPGLSPVRSPRLSPSASLSPAPSPASSPSPSRSHAASLSPSNVLPYIRASPITNPRSRPWSSPAPTLTSPHTPSTAPPSGVPVSRAAAVSAAAAAASRAPPHLLPGSLTALRRRHSSRLPSRHGMLPGGRPPHAPSSGTTATLPVHLEVTSERVVPQPLSSPSAPSPPPSSPPPYVPLAVLSPGGEVHGDGGDGDDGDDDDPAGGCSSSPRSTSTPRSVLHTPLTAADRTALAAAVVSSAHTRSGAVLPRRASSPALSTPAPGVVVRRRPPKPSEPFALEELTGWATDDAVVGCGL